MAMRNRARNMNEREAGARDICTRLRQAGYEGLWAGGCVRDWLLGIPPRDYDIVTNASFDAIRELFPKAQGVGAAFGVALVPWEGIAYEVATFRSDGPYLDGRHPSRVRAGTREEDAARRDFTINALYFDPHTERVLDLVGGEADLRAKIVRAVGDPEARFAEDHLRLLRAARFAARLGFALEPETESAMRRLAPSLARISAERVREELLKMLTEGGAPKAFELLDRTGLLPVVLPEIAAMKGVPQPEAYHPEGDVWNHTLACLARLEGQDPVLALAVLLHDVGKPGTVTFEDRVRFNEHDKVGADLAAAICQRLRCSNECIDTVRWLVGQHMRLMTVMDMREDKRKRLLRDPRFPLLARLGRIDCLGSHGDTRGLDAIEAYQGGLTEETLRPAPLLTGRDLIGMGYAPGPLFSEILTQLEDAQLQGTLHSAEEARTWVQTRWPETAH